MLSTLASVPSGVSSFVNNRRKTLSWVAGTVGGAYVLSKWTLRKVGEVADTQRRQTIDRDNLTRRFHLNQQDCQFTVAALLPTVSMQILSEMDVESYSAQLARAAAEAKARERLAEEQRQKQQKQHGQELLERQKQEQRPDEALQQPESGEHAATAPNDDPAEVSLAEQQAQSGVPEEEVSSDSAAPSGSDNTAHLSASMMDSQVLAEATTRGGAEPAQDSVESENLDRSWAQIVREGDRQPQAVARDAAQDSSAPLPSKSRAELWNDIKILSFTRTITSIYVLTLLTLQTHVQLNLLGRAAYVVSVLSALPETGSATDLASMSDDRDLEMASYAEKSKQRAIGISKDTERRYLTFSWWLLHRGWKQVAERVERAVQDVVGPMGLKSPIVYGELSTLFGQIRQKIDFEDDGRIHDFTSALFPSTSDDEIETLREGGLPEDGLRDPVPAELRRLLNETVDCLEAADCVLVRKLCLDRLFSQLVLGMEQPFRPRAAEDGRGSRFEDVTERQARLASVLPAVARQSHLVLNGMPNEFIEALEDVRELNEFSAILYSSFDRDNVRGSC
ncbi:peroxin [Microbotryomycetes sp. JL201]|nr:peroxin [Microbotryomycetes sp. JL201]